MQHWCIDLRHDAFPGLIAQMQIWADDSACRSKIDFFATYVGELNSAFACGFLQKASEGATPSQGITQSQMHSPLKPIMVFIGHKPFDVLNQSSWGQSTLGQQYVRDVFLPRTQRIITGAAERDEGIHTYIERDIGAHVDLDFKDAAVCFIPSGQQSWVLCGEPSAFEYMRLPLDELLAHEWSHLVCPPMEQFVSLRQSPYWDRRLCYRHDLPDGTLFLSETTYSGAIAHETQYEADTVAMVNAHYRRPLNQQLGQHREYRTVYSHLICDSTDMDDPQQVTLGLIDSYVYDLPGESEDTLNFQATRNGGQGVFYILPNGEVGRLPDEPTRQFAMEYNPISKRFDPVTGPDQNPKQSKANTTPSTWIVYGLWFMLGVFVLLTLAQV